MRLKNLDKVRLLTILPLSLAFIVFGSIILSEKQGNKDNSLLNTERNNTLTTEIEELSAQGNQSTVTVRRTSTWMPEPPSPTPIPTTVPAPPSPTPIPTSLPALSCSSSISYSGSGQNLIYILQVNHTGADSRTFTNVDLRPHSTAGQITLEEYTSNCATGSTPGLIECKKNPKTPIVVIFKVAQGYSGNITLKVETEKSLSGGGLQADSCNASMNVSGINTPPTGMPVYSGGSPVITPYPSRVCDPMKEFCTSGANLVDDVKFPQSHDGSFENPVCTRKLSGAVDGDGCPSMGDQATYFESDSSIQIPIFSEAFFEEMGGARPEYVGLDTVGPQICEEKPQTHGNRSFKIFAPGSVGLKAGLCIPMKGHTGSLHAGINFRVTQDRTDSDPSTYADVTFKLGFLNRASEERNLFNGAMPSLTADQINWVDDMTITKADYGGEGAAYRFAGGFLEGTLGSDAQALCFMAEASSGQAIATFWDAAFATTEANACENALDHSDGIDRSCGGYACGDEEYSNTFYTDNNQKEYAFDMPVNWQAKQCHYESESNGADSPYGALFIGLDLNSCDKNYTVAAQREINPNFDCASTQNWTYGYSWTGGIKDFGLLQYLDCALTQKDDEDFKGTENNPFFCDQVLKSYSNTKDIIGDEDPGFTLRYSNTYSGLVNAIQAEGNSNFWKVPLLGSAVAKGVINYQKVEDLVIDPFLISKRNSGRGLNNTLKFNLEDSLISQILRTEQHVYEDSIIPQNEVSIDSLLANGPVCNNIQGDPVTKIHYGTDDATSDRAIFGFADDNGTFEHTIKEENFEITKTELCNYQFRDNRVVGAECTFENIGDGGRDVTFTEDNIGSTLEAEGFVSRLLIPTLPPPNPPGTPLPGFDDCPSVNLCGANFECGNTMRQLYDQCISTREVSEVGGNPFIRWERANGWKDLQVFGLNKVMDSSWHNELIHYNYPIRHENVGIDINQVVSVYDQQQPKCSQFDVDNMPVYCQESSPINKAAQVCRRVEPYNCGCSASNLSTCLMDCKAMLKPPPPIEQIGIPLEGTVVPTLAPGPGVVQPVDRTVRSILENDRESFLEKFISILKPKTYDGEGAENYIQGEVYTYQPHYEGGFLLANTGSGVTQCTTDTSAGSKTGVSQVRLENYFAYAGQLARINERIGFAATNNSDPDSYEGDSAVDPGSDPIADVILQIVRGEGEDFIALPYCDLMTEEERKTCSLETDKSCDCMIRSCQDQFDAKIKLTKEYLPTICKRLIENNPDTYGGSSSLCYKTISEHWITNVFSPARETCQATPKSNTDFNCDPMANYLISQGFDSPELQFAKCDIIYQDGRQVGGDGNLLCFSGGVNSLFVRAANGINSIEPRISAEVIHAIASHEGLNNLSGDPSELDHVEATLGEADANGDGNIFPICATSDNSSGCEYDVRGIMQFQNFTFLHYVTQYAAEMKACTDALGVNYTIGRTGDAGMEAALGSPEAYQNMIFSRLRVGDNICAGALLIAKIGRDLNGGNYITPERWKEIALAYTEGDMSNLLFRTAIKYTYGENSSRTDCGPYTYCNDVAVMAQNTYQSGGLLADSTECTNFIAYGGTCEEILSQVNAEEAYGINRINYSSEMIPRFEDDFAGLGTYNYFCHMGEWGRTGNVYCFRKAPDGTNDFDQFCLDCPVRVTALFRHELAHVINPYIGAGAKLDEFAADAISNNGGWYKFKYKDEWLFATQVVDRIAAETGISSVVITNFLKGLAPNPGVDFPTIFNNVDYCGGRSGISCEDVAGVGATTPPGLESSNCKNIGGTGLLQKNQCGITSSTNIPNSNDGRKYEKIITTIETAVRRCGDTGFYESLGIEDPYPYQDHCPFDNSLALAQVCREGMGSPSWPTTLPGTGPLDIVIVSPKFLDPSSPYYSVIGQMGSFYAATTEEGYLLNDGSRLTYPNTLLVNFDAIPDNISTTYLMRLWLHEFTHMDQAWTIWRQSAGSQYLYQHHKSGTEHSQTGRFFEACADEAFYVTDRYQGRKRLCALRKDINDNGLINAACKGDLQKLDQVISRSSKFDDIFIPYGQNHASGIIPAECNNFTPPEPGTEGLEMASTTNFDIVKMEKSKFRISQEIGPARLVSDWAGSTYDVVVNSALFQGDYQPSGYFRDNGTTIVGTSYFDENAGGPEAELRGILTFSDEGTNVSIRRHREGDSFDIEDYDNVMESIPLFIESGSRKSPVRPWTTTASLTVFGYDSSFYYVIVTKPGMASNYNNMMDELLGAGYSFDYLLNLDGGKSTGLYVPSLGYEQDSRQGVPVVLQFTRR